MTAVVWFRGVPWEPGALRKAQFEEDSGLVEVVTEIAREIRAIRSDRPEPGSQVRASRAGWTAVLSSEMVVVGYGEDPEGHGKTPEPEEAPQGRRKSKKAGRGPNTVQELIDWLADEGYVVQTRKDRGKGGGHPTVLSPSGVPILSLPMTPSDPRSVKNATAACRRVLGVTLRRNK